MNDRVITRFAPSPTGYLHIGGARTALFNWLYAKAHNGTMLLRIEDTDRARSTDEAVDALLDGLNWLGLDWDGEPVSQFSRSDRHREVAEAMITSGAAYRCSCTPPQLEAMREKAKAEGRNPVYDGTCREKVPHEIADGEACVVRLKTPLEGETIINDQVQGEVHMPNDSLDDFVLLRSDGSPTYMLAVVVDDHDMGVTHIIRGDDHLTNAAKQILIYQAMQWDIPVMAHIPLIYGPDGAKLSKRHGAIGAQAYRALGYLPEAMRNYLVRLGWAHGDDEIMSLEQMIEWFGFDGMNKAPARFDFTKLDALNAQYMRATDDKSLMQAALSILPEMDNGPTIEDAMQDETRLQWLLRAIPALKERSKTLVELIEAARFVYANQPLDMDEKAQKLVTDGKLHIKAMIPRFKNLENWDHNNIEQAIKIYCEEAGVGLGKVAQPIRAALTGMANSPGAFDMLLILGKTETIIRLEARI